MTGWQATAARLLSPQDRARIACQVRSGDGVDNADAEMMLATIESLEATVRRQAQRVEDVAPSGAGEGM